MRIQRKPFAELIDDRIHNRIAADGLQVLNAAGPKATIRIYDEIGFFGITAEDFARALDEVTADEIEVQISSLGGDVFDGVAIYNALRAHPASVTTRVDSMAASIASVIAQAGDRRVMLSGSQMMIHEAWGFAVGNSGEMRKLADILDKQTDVIAGIYSEVSGGDRDGFLGQMRAESWFDADEAVGAGLADEVVKPESRPADRWSNQKRFTDQLAAAVAAVEGVVEDTENVVTFRSSQGKPPLSDEASDLVGRMVAALGRLSGAVAPEATEQETEQPSGFSLDVARMRHEWDRKRHFETEAS